MLDIADDFVQVADGLSAVVLRARDSTTLAVEHSLRRAISHREAAASDGKYTTSDVTFHLPVSEVADRPELGSYIEDADGDWRILEVAKETLSNRWRCVCRNLGITAGLDTLLTLEVSAYDKGTGGAQEPTWSVEETDLRGKVQLESADRAVEHNRKHLPRNASIYLAVQVLVSTNHRFVGPDNTIYKVISWESPDRIDALFKVNCEVTEWPLS